MIGVYMTGVYMIRMYMIEDKVQSDCSVGITALVIAAYDDILYSVNALPV